MARTATFSLIACLAVTSFTAAHASDTAIVSGAVWRDTDGNVIEAHGGGILFHEGTYYWYGENHHLGLGNKTGISCYSSPDLLRWKNEGVVLPKTTVPEAYRDDGVCERPKVLFNSRTKKFVMWMHLDAEDYTHASAGVAIADAPQGPFRFQRSFRPIAYDYGAGTDAFAQRLAERAKGNTYRDMTLFQDDDGTAYTVYASESNASLYVCQLDDDYTDIVRPAVLGKTWTRALPAHFREAPAVFKHAGKYYLLTSGLTGWAPNAGEYAIADHMLGPWTSIGNPFVGYEAEKTFRSQSTCVLPAPGKPAGSYIYMGDRWIAEALETSSYIWQPFVIGPGGVIAIENYDHWNLNVFDADATPPAAPEITLKAQPDAPQLSWSPVAAAAGYRIFRNGLPWRFTADTRWSLTGLIPGVRSDYCVQAVKINRLSSPLSNTVSATESSPRPVFLDEVGEDSYDQAWGVLQRLGPQNPGSRSIAGREFARGIFTHSGSRIVYSLGGNYGRFTAWTGRTPAEPNGEVQFRVYGDGRLLYLGDVITGKTPARLLDIDIGGVVRLELVVLPGSDGDGYDGSYWAEAQLHPRPAATAK